MITTLLLDVDGVLLIGDPWHKELAATHGITDEMLAVFFRNSFQPCLTGQADLKEELAAYLTRWGWPSSVDEFIDYWFCHYTLNEELLQSVRQLREQGVRCYLATQQERYRTDYLLRTLNFAHLFDGCFSSVDIGYMKSDQRFFATVLRKLDECAPAEMLFWDDHAGNVAVAREMGIQAEVYSDFASFVAKMQDYGRFL